ncbi:MAG: GTP cyclohydrolase I FolE [Patescibacteria group bacterium]
MIRAKKREQLIVDLLKSIGEDPDREDLKNTPKRVAKMWEEFFKGYDPTHKPVITTFKNKNEQNNDQLIIDTGHFFSHCEHHLVPFFGKYYFAYIPNKKIIGLSKIARVVDYYAARLQIQERLVREVADEINSAVKPKGLAFVLRARHLCKEMRGVLKYGGEMTVSDMRGVFKTKKSMKMELVSYINTHG